MGNRTRDLPVCSILPQAGKHNIWKDIQVYLAYLLKARTAKPAETAFLIKGSANSPVASQQIRNKQQLSN
jgi:hypothetical protein